ncbi:MAG TPA: Cys-tRNA(Pro) deacylase [Alphaproteobacteria bacterium]|nr:Cys-tRNA(Pro) deacylase [Alphaproteobacteria bacterium]
MGKPVGRATPAIAAAAAAGIAYEVHEYESDPRAPAYGLEAAEKLGLPPETVFKTLVAELDGATLAVAVIPVAEKLNLKALAALAGAKRAEMADPAKAERSSGYVVGGISPLGQKRRLRSFVDETALLFDRVNVSAGRRGLEIALAPTDLVRLLDAVTGDLTVHREEKA